MNQDTISAQVSLYPLRQSRLGPAISRLTEVLRASGLDVRPGPTSTVVAGESGKAYNRSRSAAENPRHCGVNSAEIVA